MIGDMKLIRRWPWFSAIAIAATGLFGLALIVLI